MVPSAGERTHEPVRLKLVLLQLLVCFLPIETLKWPIRDQTVSIALLVAVEPDTLPHKGR